MIDVETIRATARKKYHAYGKWNQIKRKFGITQEQYVEMFNAQGGYCPICGKHQSELDKSLCVDHNHNTGKIRGLLCFQCNAGLGRFEDNKNSLLAAVSYLDRCDAEGD